MTGPIETPEAADEQPSPPVAVDGGAGEAGESAGVPAWIPPDSGAGPGSGSRRGRLIAIFVGVIGVGLVVGYVALVFLGTQVESTLRGTVEFGTGGTGCSVSGGATSFTSSSSIHVVAHLEREVPAGESVTLAVTMPDGTTDAAEQTFAEAGDCIASDVQPGLEPGHYVVEIRAGAEILSRGELDITP